MFYLHLSQRWILSVSCGKIIIRKMCEPNGGRIMIQDIEPKRFKNEFHIKKALQNNYLLCYQKDTLLCRIPRNDLFIKSFFFYHMTANRRFLAFKKSETSCYIYPCFIPFFTAVFHNTIFYLKIIQD